MNWICFSLAEELKMFLQTSGMQPRYPDKGGIRICKEGFLKLVLHQTDYIRPNEEGSDKS